MHTPAPRTTMSLDAGWRFTRGDPSDAVRLVYAACQTPFDQASPHASIAVRTWILPSGNRFISNPSSRYRRPPGDPDADLPYVKTDFDDSAWEMVDLPHDWAIKGPFLEEGGGGMGRLPTEGVGWYRRKIDIPAADAGKSIFLDVEGAMSYSIVWLNGRLVGGWPYGYASFRLDLTPFCLPGGTNQLVIRLDNPPHAARWYPGAGLYRHVRLVKTESLHVGQWGTQIMTPLVTSAEALVRMRVTLDNDAEREEEVDVVTTFHALTPAGRPAGRAVASIPRTVVRIPAHGTSIVDGSAVIPRPKLWGPCPQQRPHLYLACTTVTRGALLLDRYETRFGVRSLHFDPEQGLLVNGEHIRLRGVNEHHDLGALGAAFSLHAARRKLAILQEMGCNAIRTAHNPPAPAFLDLADEMGFLVLDEIFDAWYREKTPGDFHLIFGDWHEQDLRAFMRRDRNHPSVFMWSVGNEVGEQYTGEEGAAVGGRLAAIAHEEDPTRPVAASINWAKPDQPFARPFDVIALNYQGVGVRTDPPQYDPYHQKYPGKLVFSSETAAALSSRGEYHFPVPSVCGAVPSPPRSAKDRTERQVSGYELYHTDFGSTPDAVFAAEDAHPFVAGEFVWSGFDYLGEPTPFDQSRSSYFGIIDLAGFPKDRYYLYQARWRPELPMAHILPHWTWPDRIGQVTPVHVFTSGDEAELMLNGVSLGRRKKGRYEYRLRWDDIVYTPGTLVAVAYKNGKKWAVDKKVTAGTPARLALIPDRRGKAADGEMLSFVTCAVTDEHGVIVPYTSHRIHFTVTGPGEIVATDNGDPTDMEPFSSPERNAFHGLCLVIIRAKPARRGGSLVLAAATEGLAPARTVIKTKKRH